VSLFVIGQKQASLSGAAFLSWRFLDLGAMARIMENDAPTE